MRKLVDERVKAGVDWIKVFGSRGGFENVDGTQTVTFDEMKAIVDAAHALGKKVAIHSYGATGVRDAVRAGADSIEHGADVDDETLAEMVKRGTVWVPTVDHNRYYIDAQDEYGFAPGSDVALKDYIERNLDVGAARGQGRREARHGIGRGVFDVRPEHARARVVREGRHDAGAGARDRDDDRRGAAGDGRSTSAASRPAISPTSSRSKAIRLTTSTRCSPASAGS